MGTTEIIFIFVIYLLLFGAKGIPSLAKSMGDGIRHFRSATDDIQREIMKGTNDLKSDFKKATDLRSQPKDKRTAPDNAQGVKTNEEEKKSGA
ncbi:MAG: twin-arginine translocase TatA/TatE family subunit [Flavobacteriales bacterium]|nr:twin-arginine translocase TatA/TatE family subunit [Flavobacteriales bacterium]|tara:strand:- start:82 stop:360 length:279 start_codon:yes stop_codon:yes gene_type:complete